MTSKIMWVCKSMWVLGKPFSIRIYNVFTVQSKINLHLKKDKAVVCPGVLQEVCILDGVQKREDRVSKFYVGF